MFVPRASNPILRALWKIHRAVFRATGGRIGSRVGPLPVLLLTTKGRRSGESRDVVLNYVDDAGVPVVYATYAVEDRDPKWYRNLAAEPRAEVTTAGRTWRVRARTTTGEERERLWNAVVARDASYGVYPDRTSRVIPVVRLETDGGVAQPR